MSQMTVEIIWVRIASLVKPSTILFTLSCPSGLSCMNMNQAIEREVCMCTDSFGLLVAMYLNASQKSPYDVRLNTLFQLR